jgi:hypothetical protein
MKTTLNLLRISATVLSDARHFQAKPGMIENFEYQGNFAKDF